MKSQWKNGLIRLFFRTKEKDLPPPKNPKNILIVSTTGLGDTLWATPAIASLKESHPDAKIFVLTSPLGNQVLNNNPHIEKCFVFDKPYFFSFFRCRSQLKKRSFDCIFIFHSSQRLVFPLCASLNTDHLIGTTKINKGLDFLFTKLYPSKPIHEAQRRLELVSFLGASEEPRSLKFYIKNPKNTSQDLEKSSILLHPGAKDRYKCWPISCFTDVASQLLKKGFRIFLSGTPEEQDLIEMIQQKVPEATILKKGSIDYFAKQISQMDLVITNDTGPMHMATALDVPVITLFAPTNPELCGPFHAKKAIVLQGNRTCTPCLKRKCREPFCLLQTSPSQVLEQAELILKKGL